MKQIKIIRKAAPPHMVGDGFKVKGYIRSELWKDLSPFLMLDYVAPWQLLPTQHPRGVDVHPHKGFETVTILWEGALAHADSSGGKGKLFAGDVQWMTAGSGILHKEFHEEEFSRTGGVLHSAQLWVNLPARYKNTPPAYQDISAASIPVVPLPGDKGHMRIIAGEHNGVKGPARTFTRINIFDVQAMPGAQFELTVPAGDTTSVLVLKGTVLFNEEHVGREDDLVVFEREESVISVHTNNDTHLLVLSGEPIDEPIAAYGPFVMNTQEEIQETLAQWKAGTFGTLT